MAARSSPCRRGEPGLDQGFEGEHLAETQREARSRDPEAERAERAAFVVLLHAFTMVAALRGSIAVERIAADLAYDPAELAPLVDLLVRGGYAEWDGDGRRIAVTPFGRRYLEGTSGRRRSVRPGAGGDRRTSAPVGGRRQLGGLRAVMRGGEGRA
jgi:hypothetical protein